MPVTTKAASARAFVRSVNILLKFAKMYDFGHPRTSAQYATTWKELQAAIGDEQTGLLLSASGDQLLLDGVPLESAQAEKSFARLLSNAGIASIHFSNQVTQGGLARFAKAFPMGGSAKPQELAEQLKSALEGTRGITINEVCFVPTDSAVVKGQVASHLAVATLGMEAEQVNDLFKDPQKLLQMIAAAEGRRSSSGGESYEDGASHPGGGKGRGDRGGGSAGGASGETAGAPESWRGGSGSGAGEGNASGDAGWEMHGGTRTAGWSSRWTSAASLLHGSSRRTAPAGPGQVLLEAGLVSVPESELQSIVQLLAKVARAHQDPEANQDLKGFQSRLATLSRRARVTLSQALAGLAAQAPNDKLDQDSLMRLAEHVAIRYAMDSYQRGDVKVDAVRQFLERLSKEVEMLRRVVNAQQERMSQAGIEVPDYTEVLAQKFWEEVPEEEREKILLSPKAWCIPARNVMAYVDLLRRRKNLDKAQQVLNNYASCITREDENVRRTVAAGLTELAPLFASGDERSLINVVREVGVQLAQEKNPELQSLMSAAFVRLTQEAAHVRSYATAQRAVELVDYVETDQPGLAKTLRSRIEVDTRLADFIEDALRAGRVPSGLGAFLRRVPQGAAEQLAIRFSRCGFREECDLLIEMLKQLGSEGQKHLFEVLTKAPAQQAVETIGMMMRLDIDAVQNVLPDRVKEWKRQTHDRVVRQLATSGAPERGRVLLALLDVLDALIRPLAIDEIGFSGEHSGDLRLLRMAEGDLPFDGNDYLRLKAIEALGRLRTPGAEAVLRRILEEKSVFRWTNHNELRIVAAQALGKVDPDFVRFFLPKSGLSVSEMTMESLDPDPNSRAIRQRRYPRMRMETPVSGVASDRKEESRIEVPEMNLAGGVAVSDRSLHPGSLVTVRLNGTKPVKAQAFVRNASTQARAFELVDIDLEERAKLRRLLVQGGRAVRPSSPENRARGRNRTFISRSS